MLEAPAEDQARYNAQLASEMTQKNLNFVNTREFCRKLWQQAKFVAKPETTFYYDKVEQLGGAPNPPSASSPTRTDLAMPGSTGRVGSG